jgi:hypothetical protein
VRTKRKIISLLTIAVYSLTLLSSQFFHSHDEEHHSEINGLSLHSHYLDSKEDNDYSLSSNYHLSGDKYFSDEHLFSSVKINIRFIGEAASEISLAALSELKNSNLYSVVECIPLSSRDNYVHSASNSSPPSV